MKCKLAFVLVLILDLSVTAGCSSTVRKPQLPHPGPANYQRNNAVQFDPYPQNDMAPAIVGGRPPDYMMPPNVVERARQQQPFGPSSPATTLPVVPLVPTAPLY